MIKRIGACVGNLNKEVVASLKEKKMAIEVDYFGSTPSILDNKELLEEKINEYKGLLKDYPFPIYFHGAFYDLKVFSKDPIIGQVAKKRFTQSIEVAHKIGATKIVFHPHYAGDRYKDLWTETQVKFWKELEPLAKEKGIKILLENTTDTNPNCIFDVLEKLNSEHFATCLDTGHLNIWFTKVKKPSELF